MVRDLYPELSRLLAEAGWRRVEGGKGSHEKWRSGDGRTVIVPRTRSRHTANAVLRQAGLAKSF